MTDLRGHVATTQGASVPRTILRRILSHHEIATLLLLLHAPIDLSLSAKPELPLLEEAGLVEQVMSERGLARFQLTPDGNAVLRSLGVSGNS